MTMTTKELLALVERWRKESAGAWQAVRGGTLEDCADELAPIATALCAEVEALRKDAERYRWLREQPGSTWRRIGFNTWNDDPSVFPWRDDEIDAAKEPK